MTTESWTIAPVASQTFPAPERLVHSQLMSAFGHKGILDVSSSSAAAYRPTDQGCANSILRPACLNGGIPESFTQDREDELRSELERLAEHEAFEAVLSVGLFEHLREPVTFLERLLKLRAPGGQIAVAALAAKADGDRLPGRANERFATLKLLTEAVLGPATHWIVAHPVEGVVFAPAGEAASCPEVDHSGAAAQDASGASCWLGTWGETDFRMPLLRYVNTCPPSREATLELRLRQAQAETRRLEAALAEERRLGLSLRQRLNALQTPPEGALSPLTVQICADSVREIAMEVWFEKQRWGLPYKIIKKLKRSFSSAPDPKREP